MLNKIRLYGGSKWGLLLVCIFLYLKKFGFGLHVLVVSGLVKMKKKWALFECYLPKYLKIKDNAYIFVTEKCQNPPPPKWLSFFYLSLVLFIIESLI